MTKILLAVGMGLFVAHIAAASTIQPGDLIVIDRGNGTLDDVNPTTGASSLIASGFTNPQGLAINPLGSIFVSDIGTSTIFEVNPITDGVTVFSGNGVGTGPAVDRPFQIAFFGGTLYVAEGGTPKGNTTAVYAIDANGNRTLVAGNNGTSNNLFSESIAGIGLGPTGTIYASEATGPHTVYTVGTGTATALTSAVAAPQGLAFDPGTGALLAVSGNPSNPLIASIDPTTGATTTLSDNSGTGRGPAYGSLRGIAVASNGDLYVTDVGTNEIYQVNPANGDRTVISGNGIGGTTFGALSYGIAIDPSAPSVPEPGTGWLLAAGFLGLLAWRRR